MDGVDARLATTESDDASGDAEPLDPRRWLTLTILLLTVELIALDTSVLNVSIPTILDDAHDDAGAAMGHHRYSLTFATFLIMGGRLGDIYGHRRMSIIRTSLFGTGSLDRVVSQLGRRPHRR